MKFLSTRGGQQLSLSAALTQGLAVDGGLFIPEIFPPAGWQKTESGEEDLDENDLPQVAEFALCEFFAGDRLADRLPEICQTSFDFPVPLNQLDESTWLLELFHGPTAAFKDFGARFLARCFSALEGRRTILVATSGDTGGAVASACFRQSGVNVVLLYPKGRVSREQERQLICWGENIHSFAVEGSFDDCQDMVKKLFQNSPTSRRYRFTSANSINIGRLLPQMTYYAQASLKFFRQFGKKPSFIIPTGNLGNAVAAFYARQCGWPIGRIVLSTNSNLTLFEYYQRGDFRPRPSVKTLANAMDVGKPSNFERLKNLFPSHEELLKVSQCFAVDDRQIGEAIRQTYERTGSVLCPHTATAVGARRQLDEGPWIAVATAHPAKFANEIASFVPGGMMNIPPAEALQALTGREESVTTIPADENRLLEILDRRSL